MRKAPFDLPTDTSNRLDTATEMGGRCLLAHHVAYGSPEAQVQSPAESTLHRIARNSETVSGSSVFHAIFLRSILVLHQYPVEATVVFTTLDMLVIRVSDPAAREELELVRDVQQYLQSTASSSDSAAGGSDRRSWEEFYLRFAPEIRRTVRDCRVPAADLEDCVQEVWMEVLRNLARFDCSAQRGRFRNWLLTLARRKALRFARVSRNRAGGNADGHEALIPCREGCPAESYERRENRAQVHEALVQLQSVLSATTYQVVHLRWIEERSVSETASRLEITSEQVYYRNCRGLGKLRGILTDSPLMLHIHPSLAGRRTGAAANRRSSVGRSEYENRDVAQDSSGRCQ
jgi:RNA polymerase sigma factor (sigma-70 family)